MFEPLVHSTHSSARAPVPLTHSQALLAHSHAGYTEGTGAGTIIVVFCNLLDPAQFYTSKPTKGTRLIQAEAGWATEAISKELE